MPYTGPNDDSLPSNVRGLSDKRKRQWISVYDSARERGMDEGRAIQMANGVVKKELGHSTGAAGKRSIDDLVSAGFDVEDALDIEIVSRWPDDEPSIHIEGEPAHVFERVGGERSVGLIDRLMDFFRDGSSPGADGATGEAFSLREMPDGRLRYYAMSTNNFQDRGGLIFTAAGQRKYADWVERSGKYPELWLWHTRGSRIGRDDKIWYDGHFQFASGLIDAGKETLARELASRNDIGMSHGYVGHHVELPDGTIEVPEFVQFERSILPHKVAANIGTYFSLAGGARDVREGEVAKFTDEQRAWFREVAHESDARIDEMERMTTDMQQFFSAHGVDFRSMEMAEGTPSTPAAPGGVTPPVGSVAPANTSSGSVAVSGTGGGLVSPAGTLPAAAGVTTPAGTLTEDDVRRISGEAAVAAVEPLLAEVRSLNVGVRDLMSAAQKTEDQKFAEAWVGKAGALPRGFQASAQGAAPAAGQRDANGALVGAGAGAVNMGQNGNMPVEEFLDSMFGKHPMLGGGGQ